MFPDDGVLYTSLVRRPGAPAVHWKGIYGLVLRPLLVPGTGISGIRDRAKL